jgi:hypothetical protein
MLCMVAASMRAVLGLVLLVILAALAFTPAFYLAFAQWTGDYHSESLTAYSSACEVKSAFDYCDVTGDKYGDWLRTFNSVLSMAVSDCHPITERDLAQVKLAHCKVFDVTQLSASRAGTAAAGVPPAIGGLLIDLLCGLSCAPDLRSHVFNCHGRRWNACASPLLQNVLNALA